MNASSATCETSSVTEPAISNFAAPPASVTPLDRSLIELRAGRRLEKVTASIERFLLNQITRLTASLDQCEAAVEQNQILQRKMAEFEHERNVWEEERQAEIKRLIEAGENLIRGWRQLEIERQNFENEKESR